MNSNQLVNTKSSNTHLNREECDQILRLYSKSDFDDVDWDFSSSNPDLNPEFVPIISFEAFADFPVVTRQLKEWILLLITQNLAIKSIKNYLSAFREFIKKGFVQEDDLNSLTAESLFDYYHFLFSFSQNAEITSIKKWNAIKTFYRMMGEESVLKLINRYHAPRSSRPEALQEKLIPESVLRALDNVFVTEDIPLIYKLIYWILRLYPNRISEVLSITVDCLEKIDEKRYCLTIPTFKQAGSYGPQQRKIFIEDEGMGTYLIELIKKQQAFVHEVAADSKFLMIGYQYRYSNQTFQIFDKSKVRPYNRKRFNRFLNKVIEVFRITDEMGQRPHVTSHMFRHNAITSRIESGKFSVLEIKELTGHRSTAMIEKAYCHIDLETIKNNIIAIENGESTEFVGKIVSAERTEGLDFIRERSYAQDLGAIGVCSDIRGCKNNPFDCFGCEHFIPESEDVEYYKNELIGWEKKLLLARNTDQTDFLKQCEDNIALFKELMSRMEEKNEQCSQT